jgi:hypothetical protein
VWLLLISQYWPQGQIAIPLSFGANESCSVATLVFLTVETKRHFPINQGQLFLRLEDSRFNSQIRGKREVPSRHPFPVIRSTRFVPVFMQQREPAEGLSESSPVPNMVRPGSTGRRLF